MPFFRSYHHIKENFADVEKTLVVAKPKNTKCQSISKTLDFLRKNSHFLDFLSNFEIFAHFQLEPMSRQ